MNIHSYNAFTQQLQANLIGDSRVLGLIARNGAWTQGRLSKRTSDRVCHL